MNEKIVQLTRMMQVSNGGHILYIYEEPERYVDNAVSYITTGIDHGHRMLVIDNRRSWISIEHKLRQKLTPGNRERVHFVDNYEFYRTYGQFDSDRIIDHANRILKPFFDCGQSVRTWAQVEWMEQPDIECRLVDFEQKADANVHSFGLISVCAYEGGKISASLQTKLMRTHDYFMTDSEIVLSNLYVKRSAAFPSLSMQEEQRTRMERDRRQHIRTEEKLKATKHQLESYITYNLDPILILNETDRLVRVNKAFEQTFGWKESEVLGLHWYELPCIPPSRLKEMERIQRLTGSGENVDGIETTRLTKDGTELSVMLSSFPLRDEDGRLSGRAFVLRDITERKQAQELLVRSEKLSIAGELAAGIAHEIRNPVTTVKGFLQLLRSGMAEKKKYYDIMASEIERIELILSELLMLAKPQAIHFEPKNIPSLIEEVVTLLDAQANLNNVRIVTEFDSADLLVRCEENQIKQVCINFMKNAIEAMSDGGLLVVQVKRGDGELLIRFIDQGCGIPDHILSKLGQPFYTTKEKGTGLGFMVSKKIIENHNGSVRVFSEEQKGTTMEIVLPVNL